MNLSDHYLSMGKRKLTQLLNLAPLRTRIGAMLVASSLAGGLLSARAAPVQSTVTYDTIPAVPLVHTVQPGETLWHIVAQAEGAVSAERVIAVCAQNSHIPTASLDTRSYSNGVRATADGISCDVLPIGAQVHLGYTEPQLVQRAADPVQQPRNNNALFFTALALAGGTAMLKRKKQEPNLQELLRAYKLAEPDAKASVAAQIRAVDHSPSFAADLYLGRYDVSPQHFDYTVQDVCTILQLPQKELYRTVHDLSMPTRRDCQYLTRQTRVHYAQQHRDCNARELAATLGVSRSTIYRYLNAISI